MSYGLLIKNAAGEEVVNQTTYSGNIVDVIDPVNGVNGSKNYPEHAAYNLAISIWYGPATDPTSIPARMGGQNVVKASVTGNTVSWTWVSPTVFSYQWCKIIVSRIT